MQSLKKMLGVIEKYRRNYDISCRSKNWDLLRLLAPEEFKLPFPLGDPSVPLTDAEIFKLEDFINIETGGGNDIQKKSCNILTELELMNDLRSPTEIKKDINAYYSFIPLCLQNKISAYEESLKDLVANIGVQKNCVSALVTTTVARKYNDLL